MEKMGYTDFIRPFENNLKKISIIFNEGNRRDLIEEEMYMRNHPGIDVDKEVRTVEKNKVKSKWNDDFDDYAAFLRYEVSTVYQNKNESSTKEFTKVHATDSLKSLYLPDSDDSYSIFSRIDITDYVYLMGDYMSENFESMKAYT